jgi:hypothetical protein
LLVTGRHFIDEKPVPRRLEFDAFYCYKGCEGGIVESRNFYMAIEKQGWGSFPLPTLVRTLPKYNPSHRYLITLPDRVAGYGRLRFYVGVPESNPAAGFNYTYGGFYNVEIVGAFTEVDTEELRVDFIASASGKPNLPLNGYRSERTLVRSRVSGSGHATFTKKNEALLIATETKGSIVHEDVYSDGTKHTLTFGIVSGTRYNPDLLRLALVLKVKESNDPDCEPGAFITTTFGTLTLVPHADVAPNGGTGIFVGVPKTTLSDPCRHAHAWTSSPRDKVAVRILLKESKP